ncbi:unnamed protein product [Sphenostylis stenocarpa]|uniref:Transmembrane protein n=1 Tax=Sphenostylis stenocarpa TaxID=92480 RepID=A0AA86TM20_9FABA|nr:unnamed protein product [Sphenostylis stenocarpa]
MVDCQQTGFTTCIETHCKYQLDVQGDGHWQVDGLVMILLLLFLMQTVFKPSLCNVGLKNVAAGEIKFHWVYLGRLQEY